MKSLTQYVNYNISQYIIRGWYNPRKKEFPEFFDLSDVKVWDNTKIWDNPNGIDWCSARKWHNHHILNNINHFPNNKSAYYYIKKTIVPLKNIFNIDWCHLNPAVLRFIKKYDYANYEMYFKCLFLKNSKMNYCLKKFDDIYSYSNGINYNRINDNNLLKLMENNYVTINTKRAIDMYFNIFFEKNSHDETYSKLYNVIKTIPEAIDIYKNKDYIPNIPNEENKNVYKAVKFIMNYFCNRNAKLDFSVNPAIFEFDFNKTNKDFVKMTNLLYYKKLI